MAREFVVEDATPEDMAALDCSSATSAAEGFADPDNERTADVAEGDAV